MNRKICVVTGTRAEYGLSYWVLRCIRETPGLELQIVACGMHLSPEFGLTYREIEADGFHIDARVDMLLSSDTPVGVTKSMGVGLIGFADAFARLQPDVVVVLGDRFEILCASQAAYVAGICLAHISGGEVTVGSLDDAFRHCITKLARYHFVAAHDYARRVNQLGESPQCIFEVGDPALDNIVRSSLLEFSELRERLASSISCPFFLVTFHPETGLGAESDSALNALLLAIDEFPDHSVLFTHSNADAGGRALNARIDSYVMAHLSRAVAVTSLGRVPYLSAMKYCAAVIGNSSSGIVEAPVLGVPTVNIGTRQDGRLKASSIIDCRGDQASITEGIRLAISPAFKKKASETKSLYGNGKASTLIASKLATLDISRWRPKQFHDLR